MRPARLYPGIASAPVLDDGFGYGRALDRRWLLGPHGFPPAQRAAHSRTIARFPRLPESPPLKSPRPRVLVRLFTTRSPALTFEDIR
jgi:hypothetical protein